MNANGRVKFNFESELVWARRGESVLSAILNAGIDLDHSCGGCATCGTCRLIAPAGLLSKVPRNELETEFAVERKFRPEERLACQLECDERLAGVQFRRPKAET
ncbi:MAG: hypothetical protein C5B49_06355 [Bdellovibrio sp.]|nr:MAG: hypothetical protein C5B49_06355 [Bdellovibrio sp.]